MGTDAMVEIVAGRDLDVSQREAWDAFVDWDRQREWMIGTRVRTTRNAGRGVGAGIVGRTALGPFGFDDPMTIVTWDPPTLCAVRHDGRLVRGTGDFRVVDIGDGRSCLLWSEHLTLPFGPLGRAGWRVVRPIAQRIMERSLERFNRYACARAGR